MSNPNCNSSNVLCVSPNSRFDNVYINNLDVSNNYNLPSITLHTIPHTYKYISSTENPRFRARFSDQNRNRGARLLSNDTQTVEFNIKDGYQSTGDNVGFFIAPVEGYYLLTAKLALADHLNINSDIRWSINVTTWDTYDQDPENLVLPGSAKYRSLVSSILIYLKVNSIACPIIGGQDANLRKMSGSFEGFLIP